ncbi:hypothetical protein D7X12_35135 [Corallococcus sicarius]|uniref:Uncharacterized protein n=1 Tax=Corallococcus sicarius TaxID=2316726 RepID=A0A3A8MPM7_9BACT|nr:hypothetical protein D7X12_35135 [Corallococcus sicarius]
MLCVAWAGCSKGDDLKAGALSVKVAYSGFRPGCVQVTVQDQEDATRQTSSQVRVPPNQKEGTLSVAVFRQAGWSRDVLVKAWAQELDCEGATVAESGEKPVSIPEEGTSPAVNLELNATDADDDGYVSTANGGTDCDDTRVEANVTRTWFQDTDTDGYGAAPVMACVQPPRTATRSGDCKDDDALVHPEQAEFRCDDLDDNCDGLEDESLNLGSKCVDAFDCEGKRACDTTDGGFACNDRPAPVAYFVDEDGDGDGTAGRDGGVTCLPQPRSTSTFATDCDESSRFRSGRLAEACDRMDNDCDGTADDGVACELSWRGFAGENGRDAWKTVAANGRDSTWLAGAGSNVVRSRDDGGVTDVPCTGPWNAAWVSASGEVFLAGEDGKLAQIPPEAKTCTQTTTAESTQAVNGLVGLDNPDGGAPTLYAVTGGGRIFRWVPPSPTVLVDTVDANLRAVHGTLRPETLLAVGAKGSDQPRAFRFNPDGGAWIQEDLGAGNGYLRSVHVVDERYAYAVGDNGLFLKRVRGEWDRLTQVKTGGTTEDLQDVLAFGQTAVYVATTSGRVLFYDGGTWSLVYQGPANTALRSLDGPKPTAIGAAGDKGAAVFFSR